MGRSIHDDARKDGDAGRMLRQPIPLFLGKFNIKGACDGKEYEKF